VNLAAEGDPKERTLYVGRVGHEYTSCHSFEQRDDRLVEGRRLREVNGADAVEEDGSFWHWVCRSGETVKAATSAREATVNGDSTVGDDLVDPRIQSA